MKIPLSPGRAATWRQSQHYKALVPVAVFFLVLIMYSPAQYVIYIIGAGGIVTLVIESVKRFRNYGSTLRGAARKRFGNLYEVLIQCTEERDIVGIVFVMERMMVLMEASFAEVHNFLCDTSFMFVTYRGKDRSIHCLDIIGFVRTFEQCRAAWHVLQRGQQELPRYLAHPEAYIREAAVERMKRLQGGSGREET